MVGRFGLKRNRPFLKREDRRGRTHPAPLSTLADDRRCGSQMTACHREPTGVQVRYSYPLTAFCSVRRGQISHWASDYV
jgi:hypothetical protein